MVYYIGVDVGTQSVRSGLYDSTGREHITKTQPLTVHNPRADHYEQSCDEIWRAVCTTVGEVVQGVSADEVEGIGFDATCSMVVVAGDGEPLPISQGSGDRHTCLMWMDHRAEGEAIFVNKCKSPVTQYVGGGFSPEQQPPKLLWLKRNLPDTWARAEHFFDLPDWLTFRATSSAVRSLCSVTCKWGYVLERGGWDAEFLAEVGLEDLASLDKLGKCVCSPGTRVPGALSDKAARELGLKPGTSVGVSMIDAHAGTLALLRYSPTAICETLCIISGTSTCIMALNRTRAFVTGVWGPYEGAVLPDTWLFEGGQTAAGSALDHVVKSHPAYTPDMTYGKFNQDLGESLTDPALHRRSRDLHIQPDLHGNRSPLALPWFRGMVCGLDLDPSYGNLLSIYLATVQGLALGVRLVVDKLKERGINFSKIVICGGLAANPLYLHVLATVARLPVVAPRVGNMMCAGAALLAQSAAEDKSLCDILGTGASEPNTDEYTPLKELTEYYEVKYRVYCKMTFDQIEYRKIMNSDT